MDKFARFRFQPCIPLGKDGRCLTGSAEHAALARKAAAEGMVLLKNDSGALPLKKGETVALFGKAAIEYIKGGGGSSDVNARYVRNIYEGFREKELDGKVALYTPLIDFYRKYVETEAKKIPTEQQIGKIWDKVNAMPYCQERDDITYDTFYRMHVAEAVVPDGLIVSAAEHADTAVITISRFSAEGTDRRPTAGDYYLSDSEKALIDRACALFQKVVIVLNVGAVVDCEFFAENPKIPAVLMAWQGGMEGGAAIADILCGDVNPSGKLADTIAKSYDFYPTKEDFIRDFSYLDYSDDIYVGYRYFETVPGAQEQVRYPFGYGLSYTGFSMRGAVCGESDGKIVAAVTVTNTGSCAGRAVVELYYSAPQGKLGKPARELAAFKKTALLAPGASEVVALSFDIGEMASFDDTGKICKAAYVLEKGRYAFYLGSSVRAADKLAYEYEAAQDTVVEQLTSLCAPSKLEKRMLSDGSYEKLPTGTERHSNGFNVPSGAQAPEPPAQFDAVGETVTLDEFVAQFTDDELTDFVGGHAPTGVANTGCFGGLARLGVPAVPTADGPAGLRLNTDEVGIYTTAWPCATLFASTWDVELVERFGAASAAELRENNLGIWLAPALNIHRDPLCGRNFEYFSEDPLLTGKIAAAEIRGIQSRKVAVSMKHFACNSKEGGRTICDARLSERALREIYLKGFEISVKEADPWAVMSSYNLINGQHTSESYELLTGILRNEWGFDGMVTTDWGVKNDPVQEVKAGNDMKMPQGYPQELKTALESGELTRADLEVCVKRILGTFLKLA